MKIDIVYMWVDGNDPIWSAKRNRYLPSAKKQNAQAFGDCRFVERDELKYSLRSIEMFAPWINHIFIVTDNQTPKWIDTSNRKITIIDHKEILPQEALPTFNSTVIELGLANIPGLSEHFLLSNDDMMFNRSVSPRFFFTDGGKPICRFMKKTRLYSIIEKICGIESKFSIYNEIVDRASSLISKDYSTDFMPYIQHHNIDAYSKSSVLECMQRYKDLIGETIVNRFRTEYDFHRHAFALYSIVKGHAIMKTESDLTNKIYRTFYKTKLFKNVDSIVVQIGRNDIKEMLERLNPALVCFNDGESFTEEDHSRMSNLLEGIYSLKSSFEK